MYAVEPGGRWPPIDRATLDAWSAPYRGWHYHPDPVIPSDLKIPGHEKFHSFDVPTVYQLPGQPGKWFMSFIGFNGQGYNSFVAESTNLRAMDAIRAWPWASVRRTNSTTAAASSARSSTSPTTSRRRALLKQRDGKFWTLYGCYPRQGGYELRPGYEGVAVQRRRADLAPGQEHADSRRAGSRLRRLGKGLHLPAVAGRARGPVLQFLQRGQRRHRADGRRHLDQLARLETLRRQSRSSASARAAMTRQFCSDGKVFRDGDHWVMFYFGVGKGGAHIMAAFSRDLQHWTSHPEPLYQAGGHPGGLDRQYAHKISLVHNPANDTFYLTTAPWEKRARPETRGAALAC